MAERPAYRCQDDSVSGSFGGHFFYHHRPRAGQPGSQGSGREVLAGRHRGNLGIQCGVVRRRSPGRGGIPDAQIRR